MAWSKISPETIVRMADKDRNREIVKKEFEDLLNNKLNFHISFKEVCEVFQVIDTSNNGSINVNELGALLK